MLFDNRSWISLECSWFYCSYEEMTPMMVACAFSSSSS